MEKIDIENQLALQNLQEAINQSSIVSVINTYGIVTNVNDKFCEISKYSKDEIIGKDQRILRSNIHTEDFYTKLWDTISHGHIWQGEICDKAKDGSLFWNKATIVPFKNKDGKIYEYVVIRTDITKQKEKEIHLQKTLDELKKSQKIIEMQSKELVSKERLSAIGQLSARLAHDLRNPLSALINYVHIIKTSTEEETTLKNCQLMQRALDRISHQVEDVLDFVRTKPLERDNYYLEYILNTTLSGITQPNNIEIETTKENPILFCDKIQFEVVLNNLILNAIQKLENGGKISIDYKSEGDFDMVSVSDSGEDIPHNIMEKIFEPLFTTKQKGTGLGLVSCKRIIEEHRGTISAKNKPTTFIIKIPKQK